MKDWYRVFLIIKICKFLNTEIRKLADLSKEYLD